METYAETGQQGAGDAVRSERRAIAVLLGAFWLAFQVIFYAFNKIDKDPGLTPASFLAGLAEYIVRPVELAIVAFGAGLSLGLYLTLRRVRRLALWKQLVTANFAALLTAMCFSVAVSVLGDLFDAPWPSITPRTLAIDSLRWLAPFVLWAVICLTVTYNSEIRERERRLALFQAQAQDAQMRALRYQVNPHLLYNTLNSIAALILDGKNELAEAMVLRLSSFFRASLSNDPNADVLLADEVALQRLYLEIEQMRFPSLETKFDVPVELGDVRVPSLILQPLIENVLRHGINPEGLRTEIAIGARRVDGRLQIQVRDNGPGISTNAGTGVGLRNVEGRLRSRFGDRANLEAKGDPGNGFMVLVTIPIDADD